MLACPETSNTEPKLINNPRARETQSTQSKDRRINHKTEFNHFRTMVKTQMIITICMMKSISQRKKESDCFRKLKTNMKRISQKKGVKHKLNQENKTVLIGTAMED